MATKFPAQSFTFRGFTFRAHRQFTAAERRSRGPQGILFRYNNQGSEAAPVLRSRESGWSYADFYRAAQAAGAGQCDLFLVEGRGQTEYLPTSAYLSILPAL